MLKLYRINDINLFFDADADFETTPNMVAFERVAKRGPTTECEFISGDTSVPADAKLIFHKLPLSVYSCRDTVIRSFTPPLMNHPVAKTVLSAGKSRVVYDRASRDYVLRSDNMLNLIGFDEIAQNENEFILHCSYIELDGRAVLFSGRSGIGKSTRAELWHKEKKAVLINGDKALLSIRGGNVYASGLPIAGSSGVFINRTLPVAAIVFLDKAKDNNTLRLDGSDAFINLYNNMIINTWNSAFCDNACEFISAVIERIPVFYSECNLAPSSVAQQYDTIFGK